MIFLRSAAALLLLTGLCAPASAQDCTPGELDLRDSDSTLRFQVEVMDSEDERAQGLMFRESLPKFSGMLFVYEAPGPVAFWMRNTLIPLDMLFFDETGSLVKVHENAVPLDETPIVGGTNIQYVLEINGGLAKSLDLGPDTEMRHPSVEADVAAWACEG